MVSLTTITSHAATKIEKYIIKKGDTLSAIAQKYHTTVTKMRKTNGLKKGEVLKLGRSLKVPKNTSSSNKKKKVVKVTKRAHKKPTKHVVKSGDTLSGIAHKNHTTIAKVRKANNLKKGQTLKLGKVLKIPNSSYAKRTKKKTFKIAKVKKSPQDKKLARALMNIKSNKPAKSKGSKSQKIVLDDIFFSGTSNGKSANITKLAKKKLGRKYVWGAVGQKNTFDCSGLTSYVCKKNGISIPRRAIAQSKHGKYVNRSDLKPGDLIFFDTSKKRKGYVNHVGIYLGNDKFIHASSAKKKVVITKLGKSFYSKRYKGARRVAS